jgi:GNAT superfamily N-acetyltransferase
MAAASQIAPARWPEDTDLARTLLSNYGEYLATSPIGSAGVCLVGYEEELRALPGKYAGPAADLLLARVHGEGAGCVAVTRRVLADGTDAVEMKRLWVEPKFRGLSLGRGLVHAAMTWTRARGWSVLVLDTVNETMPEAARLYQSLGFVETGRFNDNPVAGVRFYQLKLR